MSKFCIGCGERLPAEALFCPECGKAAVFSEKILSENVENERTESDEILNENGEKIVARGDAGYSDTDFFPVFGGNNRRSDSEHFLSDGKDSFESVKEKIFPFAYKSGRMSSYLTSPIEEDISSSGSVSKNIGSDSETVFSGREKKTISGQKTLSTRKFFFLMILFSIPVIGWLFCFVMAFVPKNVVIKSFARAALSALIFFAVLFTILFFIYNRFGTVIGENLERIFAEWKISLPFDIPELFAR